MTARLYLFPLLPTHPAYQDARLSTLLRWLEGGSEVPADDPYVLTALIEDAKDRGLIDGDPRCGHALTSAGYDWLDHHDHQAQGRHRLLIQEGS